MARAFTTPPSQNAPWCPTGGTRGAANGTPETSISCFFLTGHGWLRQVKATWRQTAFVTAAVITSKMWRCSKFSHLCQLLKPVQTHREKQKVPSTQAARADWFRELLWSYLWSRGEARSCGRQSRETIARFNT